MEYVVDILKRADFSVETDLMNRLRRQLSPVREISFDDLKKKNKMDVRPEQSAPRRTVSKAAERTRSDVKDIKPPKKNGPMM